MSGPYLTLDEVAEKLGVDYKTVYRLVRGGELPAGRVGRVYRVDLKDLNAYFDQQKQAVAKGASAPGAGGALSGRDVADAWTCPACGDRYHSALSVGGRCEDTGEAICQTCWHIRRVRTTQAQPAEAAASTASAPGAAGPRAAGGASSAAPRPGQTGGAAATHAAAVPDGAVSREQAAVLGSALIRRFGQRLETLDHLTHPLSGQDVAIDKARIKHTVEDYADATDAVGGPASRFLLKWGGWGKPKSVLALECRLLSRPGKLERDGYDHPPITVDEVRPLLEDLARQAAKDEHLFHVLLLGSPTGFEEAVHALVTGKAGEAFHDRHLAVVLHDTSGGGAVVPDDERLADLMPLIDPDAYRARLDAACEPVAQQARDLGSIALADAVDLLEGDAKLARDVMSKLGKATDLALDDLPGVGLVLSRR